MNLNELFQSQLSGGLLDQLGNIAGIENPQQTETAAHAIFSTLMGAIGTNASTPDGANALNTALERDHDGSILDNLSGFLSGQTQASNSNMLNGAGILGHILGFKQGNLVNALSQNTNIDSGKILKMMITLAPVILGLLGKAKQQTGADAGGLTNIIGSVLGGQTGGSPLMGILTSVLDKNNDGNMLDDILGGGIGGMLGGLFGGNK
ncbi:MAG TPA: DUF937 domain-containing protein [Saprospiraceae bacterium]|mgnify:FL=1|jgi:hypothetical protein|nr:DUF937 domain-containing protein [Saprospiraceae bacterium]